MSVNNAASPMNGDNPTPVVTPLLDVAAASAAAAAVSVPPAFAEIASSENTADAASDAAPLVDDAAASDADSDAASDAAAAVNVPPSTAATSLDVSAPSVVEPSSAVVEQSSAVVEDENITKLRIELNKKPLIDDFACYELINKLANGTTRHKCEYIRTLLEKHGGGGEPPNPKPKFEKINDENELKRKLPNNLTSEDFLKEYKTTHKDKKNDFYNLPLKQQYQSFQDIVRLYTKANDIANKKIIQIDSDRQKESGDYAIYVKIKLILVEGDVDLDDAECKDRFNNIKTGIANIINKLPLEKTPFGKYIPDTTIKPKTVRSDTAKLSNNKTVKNKPEENREPQIAREQIRETNNYNAL